MPARPSEVVAFVSSSVPYVNQNPGNLNGRQAGQVGTFLSRVEHLDPELIAQCLSREDRDRFDVALHRVRQAVSAWGDGRREHPLAASDIALIRDLLSGCPDEAAPRSTPRLEFIADAALRESIARDVDSLPALLAGQQWKAATVIGGSALEAVLLYQVERRAAAAQAYAKAKHWKKPMDEWGLASLIEVAASEGVSVINDVEAGVCHAVRDYRNLIHAGKVRARTPPSEGTALAARAAITLLLEKWGPAPVA